MPRKAQPAPSAPAPCSFGDVVLEGAALDLFNRVSKRWELDDVCTRILRNACESLQQAIVAAEIVKREGMTINPHHGIVRHPAAQLERDHRNACSQSLAKLHLNLE